MSSKTFTAATFQFLYQINDNERLLGVDLKIALTLTRYFNETDDGRAFPSCHTLAAKARVSEHTVIRSVRRLEANGHLRVIWGRPGRGHPNQYWMIIKPAPTQVLEGEKPAPTQVLKPASMTVKPAPVKIKPAPVQENHLTNHPKNHHREKDSPPDDGFLGKKKEVAAEESNPQAASEPQAELVPAADDAFARFWAVYPRHDAETPARKAFARAIVDTDPETLITGAQCYALAEQMRLARPGQTPQHTLMAKNWLHDRRWNDPPPPGISLDEDGNFIEEETNDEDDFETSFAEYQRMIGVPEDGSW